MSEDPLGVCGVCGVVGVLGLVAGDVLVGVRCGLWAGGGNSVSGVRVM